ncbi:MAG: molecular chaperone DnaJ [Dermabacter sp.]|nr:molecular chaperone DnaJ [Dermabacter sp.]
MNDEFYEILGVSREADAEEIKRAYRKKARKLHPDVNPDPEAAEEMKRVSLAYETLSNPEKRRMYDMGGGQGGFGGFGGFGGGATFDFADIFDAFAGASGMGGRSRGPIPRQRRGNDILRRLTVDLADVIFGSDQEVEFRTASLCSRCEGTCAEPGTSISECGTCHGSGHVQRTVNSLLGQMVQLTPCPVCQGHGDIIDNPCSECSGHGRVQSERTIRVRVPSGVDSGTRIQLRGEGEVGEAGGPSGDLFVEISVREHEIFHRDGTNLIARLTITMAAAALGTAVDLDTFDGPREVVVKPGTQPGDVVRLRDLGVTALRSDRRGDILVEVQVETPTKLSGEERELLERFAALRGEDPVKAPSRADGGMFSKLRDKLRDL